MLTCENASISQRERQKISTGNEKDYVGHVLLTTSGYVAMLAGAQSPIPTAASATETDYAYRDGISHNKPCARQAAQAIGRATAGII
jgi:hypothetical protein